ncbi:hypothetical protein L6255_02540 [Candidatus Parcubacteria bacterium]|nr:hypothetical protein [Patescibacteria group bacterium]MCG2689295.1 hypothetical protein [Candidatus Parcubacteria bacterium]
MLPMPCPQRLRKLGLRGGRGATPRQIFFRSHFLELINEFVSGEISAIKSN